MIILSAAVFVRTTVSLWPYSGAGNPPMFGDYEAQRHWMEITYNLPLHQWYVNSSSNNLGYWGLDYPPLTAYHSWVMGAASASINPDWIVLEKSHGYESYHHKLFMRFSVLTTDILIFFSAAIVYVMGQPHTKKIVLLFAVLFQPALVLVDYGHFQYNSVSLGLTLWAIASVVSDWDVFGSLAFCLALNYKQMELYHSMPFFFYLLGKALALTSTKIDFMQVILKLGLAVIVVFGLCWIPFSLSNGFHGILDVFNRIFPLSRGVYEDKVASFWCSLSIFLKVRDILSTSSLVWISIGATLSSSLPSLLNLLRKPTPYQFLLSLVVSSLSFYLFSFHVHEKTILLVTLPVNLLVNSHPLFVLWFNVVSAFSMYPLLTKDGLILPMWALCGIFIVVMVCSCLKSCCLYQYILIVLSLGILFGLCVLSHVISPPTSLPDIFAVLISAYCCCLFIFTLVYLSYIQIVFPTEELPWKYDISHYIYQIDRRLNINFKKIN